MEIDIAEYVVNLLKENEHSIAFAESCTGGLMAKMITDISGSSDVFIESAVTYCNEAKKRRLSVKQETLDSFGAVSEQCVREMVEGIRTGAKSTLALAVSGIAGPGGGTPEKPVGTVWIAFANPDKTVAQKFIFEGNRNKVRVKTAYTAFKFVTDYYEKLKEGK